MASQPPTYNLNDYDATNDTRLGQGDGKDPNILDHGSDSRNQLDVNHVGSSSNGGLRHQSSPSTSDITTMKFPEPMDEPFKPPKDSGYMGYSPPQNADDIERNPYKEYHPQEHTSANLDEAARTPLVGNPYKSGGYHNLEYDDSNTRSKPSGPLAKFFGNTRYPIEQRIENKKRGIGVQRTPFAVYTLSAVMIGVFIYELVLNARQQGSPISLKPTINPMLGPSGSALIHLGARFPPCMKDVLEVPTSTPIACMDNVDNPITKLCTVADLCSFGYKAGQEPNQWFRFITAIFLHAGIIHLLLNMLAQFTLSAQIERDMGSTGFLIVYFAAGIFGNVLGGNFSLVGIPSVGASGAIFGTLAVTWVDLLAHWKYQYRPVRKLVFMTIELAIGVAIGFIPYVDNFAHLGGFLMGLLVGTIFYPVISASKRHKTIMWGFRLAAIPLVILLFVLLIRNFYTSDPYAGKSYPCRRIGCTYASFKPVLGAGTCLAFQWLPIIIAKELV
ncbi:hypothetical protein CC2G_001213 [Coprinopsis cinerea AmutBmut pab1-1]|nr:hypothetical protein CC2G_001213 [Coprinopsis cinerea AmutBmut pab1-1]